jgi:Fic family protein
MLRESFHRPAKHHHSGNQSLIPNTVIEHAVDIANAFIRMHPFANANGRMGLYLLCKSAIKAGWLINLTALELHGIVLGEENPKVEEKRDEVIRKIISASKQIDMKEFDVEAYLSKCFSELMTLEADRKVKAQGKEKKQRAMVNERMQQEKQASKAIGSETMEKFQGELKGDQWKALAILIDRGVAEYTKALGHTHILINFVKLNTLLYDDSTLETWFKGIFAGDNITNFVIKLEEICEYEEEEDE